MSKKYYNIAIDRLSFKFSETEIQLYNKLYQKYNKIIEEIDSICPESSPELFKIYLIRIANIQSIVNKFRLYSIKSTLQIQISDDKRRKVLEFNKNHDKSFKSPIERLRNVEMRERLLFLRKFRNKRVSGPPEHINVEIPEIKIKVIGRINLLDQTKITFKKYESFNDLINMNEEMNLQSTNLEIEMWNSDLNDEYDTIKKYQSEDYTGEDDIIRAIENGEGDRFGY